MTSMTYITSFYSVSIADLEKVNISWVVDARIYCSSDVALNKCP